MDVNLHFHKDAAEARKKVYPWGRCKTQEVTADYPYHDLHQRYGYTGPSCGKAANQGKPKP
ncbi:MAG TPA: hypothetical protein GXX51_02095 [Firmicutes bacterium]|nr:hypothetical protein [Bacillota bacterium]